MQKLEPVGSLVLTFEIGEQGKYNIITKRTKNGRRKSTRKLDILTLFESLPMIEIKQILSKIGQIIIDHLIDLIIKHWRYVVISSLGGLFLIFWQWLKELHQISLTGSLIIGVCCLSFCSIVNFVISLREKKRSDPNDVKKVIEDWLITNDDRDSYYNKEGNLLYPATEKDLNIKRGSLKKYLPEIVAKNSYDISYLGKDIFRLKKKR
jgi:hypothetical protein